MPAARAPRREYLLILLLGAAGAGLVLLSVRQGWAQVATHAPAPLPDTVVRVRGQDVVPLAGALGLAALAGLAAVIATRGLARRLVGGLLVVFGIGIAVAVIMHVGTAEVLAAAHSASVSQAGSVTSGASGVAPGDFPGGAAPGVTYTGQVAMTGFPWRPLALAGALAVAAAGVVAAWRGPRWPGMSSRYEQPAGAAARPAADPASMWESLTRGIDPTAGQAPAAGPGEPAMRANHRPAGDGE